MSDHKTFEAALEAAFDAGAAYSRDRTTEAGPASRKRAFQQFLNRWSGMPVVFDRRASEESESGN